MNKEPGPLIVKKNLKKLAATCTAQGRLLVLLCYSCYYDPPVPTTTPFQFPVSFSGRPGKGRPRALLRPGA